MTTDEYKDVPNMDGMFVNDLEAYYESIKDKEGEVWEQIRRYADYKIGAMQDRAEGNINDALIAEGICYRIYNNIKEHLDW